MPGNGNGGGGSRTQTQPGSELTTGEGGRATQTRPGSELTAGEGGGTPAPTPEPEPPPPPVVEPEPPPPPPPQRANIDRTSQYSTPDYASMTQTINAVARSSSPEMPTEATDYQLPDSAFGQRLY